MQPSTNLRICVFSRKCRFADLQIRGGLQICKSANLGFLEETQILRFADLLGSAHLQICESGFLEETQTRRLADLLGTTNLQICESAFSRGNADLQIRWGLQICESGFSRGNADSQICRFVGGYTSACKSANLFFLEETQIRKSARGLEFDPTLFPLTSKTNRNIQNT